MNYVERDQNGHIVYFNAPRLLEFCDNEDENWTWGIGYRDEIICLCCGAVVSLEELYEFIGDMIEETFYPAGFDPIRKIGDIYGIDGFLCEEGF